MATKHSLKISKFDGYGHEVLLDGTDIANGIDGLTITMHAGRPTSVELSMPIVDITELQDPEARFHISDATRALLIHLGWTAPGTPEPTDDLQLTPYLVVHRYRNDHGEWAWSWSCEGEGACEGHLSLDFTNRRHAEANARTHVKAEHPAPAEDHGTIELELGDKPKPGPTP